MRLKHYRTSIILAVTFTILLSTFWFLPQLAFIIFISLLLQLLLTPFVDRLERRLNRGLAAAIVLFCFIAICAGLIVLVSSTFIPTFTNFVTDFPQITEKLQESPLLHNNEYLTDEFNQFWLELKAASVDALKSSLTLLLSIFSKFIDMVIILFVTFYLLKDGDDIKVYLASLFPTDDYRRVLALFNRILSALRTYICSQLVICCLTATVVFLYFTVRSLPYASVFAMVSGISEFVPVLGPTVASLFGILLTATVDPWIAVQTAGFYLILTQVNHNIVYPTLIGKSLNLHPVAIILGIILGGEVLGPAGMFLAVPFIVICKLVIEDIYRDRIETIKNLHESRWLAKNHEDK
ncbi:AI-2E family transporter [Mitsuokella sp.]|uniref:AI-2E family transporter n=1 Tax=Mitsuokella sp. TaxID=2049034 RepID=UPI003D7D94AE